MVDHVARSPYAGPFVFIRLTVPLAGPAPPLIISTGPGGHDCTMRWHGNAAAAAITMCALVLAVLSAASPVAAAATTRARWPLGALETAAPLTEFGKAAGAMAG